jgi:hypothetical protein
MKTMTCKQMGGPCDTELHGETPDEMIASGAKHIEEMATRGDPGHKKIKMTMDEMLSFPDSDVNKEWLKKFKSDFAKLPED